MLRHADSSQFTESTDQIQLPTFDSEVVSFVLGISKTKPRDVISVDLFCQQYLIEERVRQNIQRCVFFFIFSSTQLLIRQLWDDLKAGLLENEQILIHVSENINAEQLLPWPLKVAEQLVEFSNRLFFKRFFFSHSGTCFLKVLQLILFLDHVFNLVNYLLSISTPCSSST